MICGCSRKPIFDINTVVNGVIYLFYEPNPDDPLNKARRAAHVILHPPRVFPHACVAVTEFLRARYFAHMRLGACHAQEAAKVFREDRRSFEANVYRSLRGGAIGGVPFPRLI